MGQGYTRNDTTNNIANGNVISAADLDGEFDAIVASFNETTGHTHDGTVAEGGAVSVVGPVQEYLGDGAAFYPKTTAVYTLGKASNVWANLHLVTLTLSGTATMATVDINGGTIDGTVIGATTPASGAFTSLNSSNATFTNGGGSAVTTSFASAAVGANFNINYTTTGPQAIVVSSVGGVLVGNLTATTADINGGNIDGTIIGGTTPAAGDFTSLDIAFGSPALGLNETDTGTNSRFILAGGQTSLQVGALGGGTLIPNGGVLRLQGYGGGNLESVHIDGKLINSNGTAALPAYSFSGDPDTGLYNYAANSLGVTTAGTHVAGFYTSGIVISPSDTNSITPQSAAGQTGIGLLASGRVGVSASSVQGLDVNRNTTVGAVAFWRYINVQVGSVSVSASATTYNTTSDYRTKENITAIQGPIELIRALNPITYTAISDGQWYDGFLAHEIQGIIPTAVTGELDGDEMQSMDYAKLTPLLTAGLQAALDKIDALEARIVALEALQ
jgi:hypothetical protein